LRTKVHAFLSRSLQLPIFWCGVILSCYTYIGLRTVVELQVSHDELIYLVKSWWLFSGKADWYSDELPLGYFPNAFVLPGLGQYILGQGLLEARTVGLLCTATTIFLLYFYVRTISCPRQGLIAVFVFTSSPAVFGWAAVSTYAASNLLILGVLIFSSECIIKSKLLRIIVPAILLSALLLTRLNHLVSLFLLVPAIYLSNQDYRFTLSLLSGALALLLTVTVFALLPDQFPSQVPTNGVFPFLGQFIPFLSSTDYIWSEGYVAGMSQAANSGFFDNMPRATSSAVHDTPTSWLGGSISEVSTDLIPAFSSFVNNWQRVALSFGLIGLGIVLTWRRHRLLPTTHLMRWLGISFIIFVFVSFLKGHSICSSCPIHYSQYFLVVGAIAGAQGLFGITTKSRHRVVLFMCLAGTTALFSVQALSNLEDSQFTSEQKHDIMEVARAINDLIPKNEQVLPLGFLGRNRPIRMGLFMADRFFEPSLLNPSFTFRPIPPNTILSDEDKNYLKKANSWSPQQLLEWVEKDYDYILKPTYLYYDDHEYRFWFRRVFYPAKVRTMLGQLFDCQRLPGKYLDTPPIDICIRKT